MIKKRHPDALFQFKLGPAAAGVHGEQGVRVSLQQVEQQYQKAGTYRKDLKRKNKYSHVPTLLLYQQPIINFYPTPTHNTIAYQHNQTKEDEVPYSKERANFKFDMKMQGRKGDFKLNSLMWSCQSTLALQDFRSPSLGFLWLSPKRE